MKMMLDDAGGLNVVSAYESGRVSVRGKPLDTGLLILPRRIVTENIPHTLTELDEHALSAILEEQVVILIVGTGEQQRFPSPLAFSRLMEAGIGYEIMDNRAACRTFNILLGEGREAALLLLREDN